MDRIILKAEIRKIAGRKVKTLRKQGLVPANVYGKKVKSMAVQVVASEFAKVFGSAGETGLIELTTDKEKKPVLVGNVQIHPVTGDTLHIDFRAVDLKEKVTATVPVEVLGVSPAEKEGRGVTVEILDEVEVEALPADLPEKFEVDVSNLTEVDQAIYVKDLKVDKAKVEIKTDGELIIVKIEPPQKEEVIETPAPIEGETPAEGVAATPTEGAETKPEEETTPKKAPEV